MLFKSISRVAVILAATLVSGFGSSAVPQDMKNMPGMKMRQASPSPGAQPAASPQTNMPGMNMPMPGASPSASPMSQMPGMDMGGSSGGMNMNMGPLVVVNGDDIGVRVGSSNTN